MPLKSKLAELPGINPCGAAVTNGRLVSVGPLGPSIIGLGRIPGVSSSSTGTDGKMFFDVPPGLSSGSGGNIDRC